jgi:hypothetical protein
MPGSNVFRGGAGRLNGATGDYGVICATIDLAQTGNEVSFVNEGVINPPIQEVWKALSTSEGYKATGPALAEVDLRIGGTIRTRYRADGPLGDAETIENLILAL